MLIKVVCARGALMNFGPEEEIMYTWLAAPGGEHGWVDGWINLPGGVGIFGDDGVCFGASVLHELRPDWFSIQCHPKT